jgi:long-chain acyl-CoA synthetase
MLGEMLKAGAQLPDMQMIFSGGAKLSAELRHECKCAWPGVDLVEFYGASETSFVTYHSTSKPANAGSVGRMFPRVEVEIRDDDGKAVAPGEEGAIFVSGPMLFSRYVGDGPAGEWFSAGDMGHFDADGCLYLTGRASRMIKSKGLKIHPEPIEAALSLLPEIRKVAVVDLPDAVRGAVPVAAIEFADGKFRDRSSLSARCRESLSAQHCPRRYFVTDALPLTGSGKVAVDQIRDALMSGDAAYEELL